MSKALAKLKELAIMWVLIMSFRMFGPFFYSPLGAFFDPPPSPSHPAPEPGLDELYERVLASKADLDSAISNEKSGIDPSGIKVVQEGMISMPLVQRVEEARKCFDFAAGKYEEKWRTLSDAGKMDAVAYIEHARVGKIMGAFAAAIFDLQAAIQATDSSSQDRFLHMFVDSRSKKQLLEAGAINMIQREFRETYEQKADAETKMADDVARGAFGDDNFGHFDYKLANDRMAIKALLIYRVAIADCDRSNEWAKLAALWTRKNNLTDFKGQSLQEEPIDFFSTAPPPSVNLNQQTDAEYARSIILSLEKARSEPGRQWRDLVEIVTGHLYGEPIRLPASDED